MIKEVKQGQATQGGVDLCRTALQARFDSQIPEGRWLALLCGFGLRPAVPQACGGISTTD